ncbi:MAG: NAD(P)H-dependent oxidoreductase [Bacteroidota bacterium]
MKKVLAFAGSNSSASINHKLVSFAATQMDGPQVKVVRLTDYPLPIFGEDLEKAGGYPATLKDLLAEIKQVDGLMISVNEHNGSISAFFKNTLDWLSRIEYKFLENKKILLMSASPGRRGALSAFEYTQGILPRYGGEVVSGLTFPSFSENFSEVEQQISDKELKETMFNALTLFSSSL